SERLKRNSSIVAGGEGGGVGGGPWYMASLHEIELIRIIENLGESQESAGQVLNAVESDDEFSGLEADVAGRVVERRRRMVVLNKNAELAAGSWYGSRSEKGSGIGALGDCVQEGF